MDTVEADRRPKVWGMVAGPGAEHITLRRQDTIGLPAFVAPIIWGFGNICFLALFAHTSVISLFRLGFALSVPAVLLTYRWSRSRIIRDPLRTGWGGPRADRSLDPSAG